MFLCIIFFFSLSLTLDGPLEEGLAGLTRGHAIVVTRGYVTANQTQPLGHCAQHELTLHWAFFLPEPSQERRRERGREEVSETRIFFGCLFNM